MKRLFISGLILFYCLISLAQDPQVNWERADYEKEILRLFHSPYAIVHPTAETKSAGDFLFEISHRFVPSIINDDKNFLGLDGPANIRIAFGYSISDRFMVNFAHSNFYDNTELQLKYKAIELDNDILPTILSFQSAITYNRDLNSPVQNNYAKWQYYFQFIVNSLVKDKLGIGLVPTYLDNPYIFCKERQYTFAIGTYLQYYFTDFFSVLVEWTPTISGWRRWNNSISTGIEIETGGHFFKLFFSNNIKLNPAQHLSGAGDKIGNLQDWHFGFFISRTF